MIEKLFNLHNKVILITGGYGHIGSGLALGLAQLGVRVIVAGRNKDKYDNVFLNHDKNIYFEEFDISESSDYYAERYNAIRRKYGSIDVVVNNAHFVKGRGQLSISDDDFLKTIDGVLGCVHKSIKTIVPIFREQKGGKIINISSMYGHISPNFDRLYKGDHCEVFTNPPHYGAGKAGVIQITKYYASLLGKEGIYVNAISPGPFSKQEIQDNNPKFIERLKSSNPLNKLGVPKDMVGAVVLLSTDASNFITGQNICIDGGWGIW